MAIKYEFRKMFARKEFHIIITILVIFACADFMINSIAYLNQPFTNIHSAWQLWIGFGNSTSLTGRIPASILCILMPMLVTTSFSDAYIIEKKVGLSALAFVRESRNAYFSAKLLVSVLAGFVLACIPYVLNLALCLAVFPQASSAHYSNWPASSNVLIYEARLLLFPEIDLNNPALSSVIRIAFMGLYGATCSFLGTALSFFTNKRMMVSAGIALFVVILSFIGAVFGLPQIMPESYLLVSSGRSGRSIDLFIGFLSTLIGIALALGAYQLIWKKDELL